MAELNIKTLFAALSKELQGNPEYNQRVTAHIRAVHGYNTIPSFHVAALPEKDKVTAYGLSMAAIIKYRKAKAAGDQAGMDTAWNDLQGQELPKGQAKGDEPLKTEPVEVEPTPAPKVIEVEAVVAPHPAPLPAPAQTTDQAAQLAQLLQQMLAAGGNKPATLDPEEVKSIVEAQVGNRFSEHVQWVKALMDELNDKVAQQIASITHRVQIITPDGAIKDIKGITHKTLPTLLKMASSRTNILLVGPTGSGKTKAVEMVAEALSLPFFYNGAIDTEYKLKGFTDAGGKVICPAFRKAWESGGVYCFDEVDASLPPAVLSFNGALSNDICDFPDGMVPRHKDTVIIATGNTWLGGATFDYVGRMKQDAAFADRFSTLYWDIDEQMETALCGDSGWVEYVQKARANAKAQGLKVIISPRATFNGEKLLAAGVDRKQVIASCVRKGMADDQWNAVNPERN